MMVVAGVTIVVKDEEGNAGIVTPSGIGIINTIQIVPNVTRPDTIDGATQPYVLSTNYQSVTLQCDGNGNWIVE